MTLTDSPHDRGVQDNYGHVPVLRDEVTELLAPAITAAGPQAVIMDATLGAGGHSEHLLRTFPEAMVIGFDRDGQALADATRRLRPYGPRFFPVNARFDELPEALRDGEGRAFDVARDRGLAGALFDLGVSSMQLDQPERGFAYKVDAPLDMRMDQSSGLTAADVLNTYSHGELARVLKTYGDERFAGKIASAVIREREREPFSTSGRLVDLLYATIPAATRRTGGHPAKRTFQALRVEVNRELDSISAALPAVTAALGVGGRVVFMSYQSQEDKLVKKAFARLCANTTPRGLPVDLPGTQAHFRALTRGAMKADEAEVSRNPRSASVRVRAVEKILADPHTDLYGHSLSADETTDGGQS